MGKWNPAILLSHAWLSVWLPVLLINRAISVVVTLVGLLNGSVFAAVLLGQPPLYALAHPLAELQLDGFTIKDFGEPCITPFTTGWAESDRSVNRHNATRTIGVKNLFIIVYFKT
jgi:hypothetical protein